MLRSTLLKPLLSYFLCVTTKRYIYLFYSTIANIITKPFDIEPTQPVNIHTVFGFTFPQLYTTPAASTNPQAPTTWLRATGSPYCYPDLQTPRQGSNRVSRWASAYCSPVWAFADTLTCKRPEGGHGGRVVTLSLPTSEAGVRSLSWPEVGKLVVACRWSAVYSTEP